MRLPGTRRTCFCITESTLSAVAHELKTLGNLSPLRWFYSGAVQLLAIVAGHGATG